ncbi:MAG TPA: YbhB/YbcL family Raf kinase inhibitor-like protein [Verrucomicrobiae bacterium]|nr:YbhB/YbcL family Raf kinase inhibitor-like protein [Verrucomicrobiae bacterium]
MAFQFTTTAFRDGASIPKKFTCDGPDVSPAFAWSDPPAGTRSLALIADDPDAPGGMWVHWVLYDLPADIRKLPEDVRKDRELSNGAMQGRNDFGKIGYNGPCPPRGSEHRYFFKLYALNSKTGLNAGATKSDLEHAMKGRVLAQAQLVGKYQH